MTDWQAIRDEIKKHATFPVRGDKDFLLKDLYQQSGISRTRAERILKGLLARGILREYRIVMTKGYSKVMAYHLAEGMTLDDLGKAVQELA